MHVGKLTGCWSMTAAVILLACAGFASAADDSDVKQALAVCDQLRCTLAETTTMLVETKKELAETKERLAKLEDVVARVLATKKTDKPAYTKVAVVNMTKVLRDYRRAENVQKNIDERRKMADAEVSEDELGMSAWGECADESTAAQNTAKVMMMQVLRVAKKAAIDAELRKEEDEARRQIFKDIEAATTAFAKARNIDLVLFYDHEEDAVSRSVPLFGSYLNSEPEGTNDCDSSKLRATIPNNGQPLYTGQKVDITDDVVNVLNYNYELNHRSK